MTTSVAILTGFLGSGKTTLLRRVMTEPSMRRTALIINDFGEVNIDHLLVSQVAENIVELRGGCLCCTIRVDLAMTLRDLHEQRLLGSIPAFDHVIVETTGLADPVPLLHTLFANPPMRRHFAPDAVVTCIDLPNLVRTLDNHAAAVSQIAIADALLLTKGDLVTPKARAEATARLDAINPAAPRHEVLHGAIDPAQLFRCGLFEPGRSVESVERWLHGVHHDHHNHHGGSHHAHLIAVDAPISLAGLSIFLNRITNVMRDQVLRIKGVAAVRERPAHGPAVIHAVREKFYPIEWLPHWPDGDHRTRLVFIGRGMDTVTIDRLFSELC